MIKANIVADSRTERGNRITTMVVTFPRFILAELNTHRMMSRNSASSRAIPFEKMLKSVEENPFIPIAWQKDHKGMQGTEYFTNADKITLDIGGSYAGGLTQNFEAEKLFKEEWIAASKSAIKEAERLHSLGLTKQLCNRLLEPFMWHTVIITATEWENFFALRCPQYGGDNLRSWKEYASKGLENEDAVYKLTHNKGQAEIHMMALAEAMWDALNESTPKELKAGDWHIPFGDSVDDKQLEDTVNFKSLNHDGTYAQAHKYNLENTLENCKALIQNRIKVATARCARVSYTVVGEEGKPANYENDIKLHDNLAKSGHWSPFEHCAKVMTESEYYGHHATQGDGNPFGSNNKEEFGVSGNFRGFIQYRKTFNNENITK